jgi:hypothetical protein
MNFRVFLVIYQFGPDMKKIALDFVELRLEFIPYRFILQPLDRFTVIKSLEFIIEAFISVS